MRVGESDNETPGDARSVPGTSMKNRPSACSALAPRRSFGFVAGPGFLTSGFLLAAPSHPVDSGKRAVFVPVTVAGAVPVFHRLPSTQQLDRG